MAIKFQKSNARRPPRKKVLTLAAMRSVHSPIRYAICGALRAVGPSSIRELAAYLHRSPDGLYYHVRHLMRVGIVEEAGRRPVYRRYEAIYRLSAGEFIYGPMDNRPVYRRAAIRFARAALDLAYRYYASAISATPSNPEIEGLVEFYMANARLTPASALRLKERLHGMFEDIARNEGELGQRIAVTVLMTPVLPGRNTRARLTGSGGAKTGAGGKTTKRVR